eukprot:UN18304
MNENLSREAFFLPQTISRETSENVQPKSLEDLEAMIMKRYQNQLNEISRRVAENSRK